MAEKTLYTALGHFRCRHDGGGRRYPVILMDHREFGMDPQEMTLWTALCWRLTDRQRAEDFYEELSNGMELFPRRSFSDCLDRLVTRGLVAKGSGTTDFDALYDLLGELYVVPISSSFPLKVVTFLKLLCSGTAPGSAAALFRRDRRTEPERHIMDLSRCAPLSTAELVRCAECDISATVGSQQTLALLYGDQETTSDNIVHKLCLKSTDGCIQREDNPNSVAPEPIEPYEQTERRSAQVIYGELSRMPRKLTLQQAVELPESLLRHFLSHPQLSDVDVRRLVDTGSVDEDAYTSMLLWFLAAGGDGHRLIFGGCDEVGAYMELTLWHNTAHAETFQFYLSDHPCPGYAE